MADHVALLLSPQAVVHSFNPDHMPDQNRTDLKPEAMRTSPTLQPAQCGDSGSSADIVVVSDKAMHTPKYMYALVAGVAVVKPSWLEVHSLLLSQHLGTFPILFACLAQRMVVCRD